MDIDPPGEDVQPAGVDFLAHRPFDRGRDGGDRLAVNCDVGLIHTLTGDNEPTPDHAVVAGHGCPSAAREAMKWSRTSIATATSSAVTDSSG
jgi:hypothetical protein